MTLRLSPTKQSNPDEGNGKSKLLSMEGLCKEKVVAVDADFDLIIDNYSTYTDMVKEQFLCGYHNMAFYRKYLVTENQPHPLS